MGKKLKDKFSKKSADEKTSASSPSPKKPESQSTPSQTARPPGPQQNTSTADHVMEHVATAYRASVTAVAEVQTTVRRASYPVKEYFVGARTTEGVHSPDTTDGAVGPGQTFAVD